MEPKTDDRVRPRALVLCNPLLKKSGPHYKSTKMLRTKTKVKLKKEETEL